MQLKTRFFLNEDDMKDVKTMVKDLVKRNKKETDFQETGGLGVMVEYNNKKEMCFSVYRTVGFITVKKP